MGQRHQQFIKTLNPHKYVYYGEGFEMFPKRNKTVILPFHNQWLYGRGAPLSALRVLEHAQAIPVEYRNGSDKGYPSDNSPFSSGGLGRHSFKQFNNYISAVECILNYSPKGEYGIVSPGFGGSHFMDRTNIKEYKVMAADFTMGDNNDGITIIDTTTLKYCFINISDYGNDTDINQSSSDLPYLQPVSAMDYMNAYYPVDPNRFSEYYMEEWDEQKRINEASENAELNLKIANRFKNFEVMTLDEVKAMFPKVYKEETVK